MWFKVYKETAILIKTVRHKVDIILSARDRSFPLIQFKKLRRAVQFHAAVVLMPRHLEY